MRLATPHASTRLAARERAAAADGVIAWLRLWLIGSMLALAVGLQGPLGLHAVPQWGSILALLGAGVLYAAAVVVALRLAPRGHPLLRGGALVMDGLVLMMLVHLTGGGESPFYLAFFPAVVLVAFRLDLPRALWATALFALAYGVGVLYPSTPHMSPGAFVLRLVLLVFTALAAGMLSAQLQRQMEKKHQALTAAKEDAERLARTWEAVGDAILMVDKHGEVRMANPAAIQILGASPVGKPLRKFSERVRFLDGRKLKPEELPSARALAGETARRVLLRYERRDGQEFVVRVSAVPLRDESDVSGVVLSFSDATAEIEAQRRAAMNDRLSTLGTMVAGVAHEVNNPLWFIMLNLDLSRDSLQRALAEPGLPEERRQWLAERLAETEAALGGVDRIAHITRSLKQVARSGDGGHQPEDVNQLVESTLILVSTRTKDAIALRADLRATRRVSMASAEMAQVLLNLLLNAADALGRGGGTIAVRTFDQGEHVVVEVEDDGPGIPPDALARLFTPFFTTKPEGTGLGLSISRSIVDAHGGDLRLSSALGKGTVASVRLPIACPEAAAKVASAS